MKIGWDVYLPLSIAIIIQSVLTFVTLIVCLVTGDNGNLLWMLLSFVSIFPFILYELLDSTIPDELHMNKKNKYKIIGGQVYVKKQMFWIETNHYADSIDEFVDCKIQWQVDNQKQNIEREI